ncbi:restriction endonuclease subunit S [Pectobacterium versatile]|uniref:restriction endonuclease subunit S n=1 Tax=Pectobacterium versatile TaxID=2488639 RepID=UPI001BB2DB5D|nr:restriction endonuclease subunit S [Pectobacterium versatile]
MSAGKLPEGWSPIVLGDVVEVNSGVGFPEKYQGKNAGDYPVYKVRDISVAVLEKKGFLSSAGHYVTENEAFELKGKIFRSGSTLFAKIGEAVKLNRRAFVRTAGLADNNVMAVSSILENMDKFIYYILNTVDLTEKSRSTTVPSIRKGDIENIALSLPPLAEQKIIAEKLDTLLAQVDSTKARLEQIPKILKRFRQAVLTAAVSGKLTEEWRNENGVPFSQWEHTVFDKICSEITVGYVGKMLDKYKDEGVPFLRSQNVREFKFSDKNLLYISDSFHQEIFKSRLNPGDLAIVRSGAPGTTCVIPDYLTVANCSDLVIARPSEKLSSEFGCIFMNSGIAKKNVSDNRVGIAQQHFNVGSMKKMPINLPPLPEQHEIVRRMEQLLAYADTVEKQVNAALGRVNNLTQSILAKAFRGELTGQWREENPDLISGENSAAALLEKIKAERAASVGKKVPRKKG